MMLIEPRPSVLRFGPDLPIFWSDFPEDDALMAVWQIQDAKARFSELIVRACREGPQTITRHGAERAVVLSIEDYRALTANKPDFREHLIGGPKFEDFSIERDRDTGRAIEF